LPQAKDGITVNETLSVERTGRGRQGIKFDAAFGRTRHLLNAHVEHISKAPTAGEIRAGLLRDHGGGGMERIGQ
jgi:hypothetical protein